MTESGSPAVLIHLLRAVTLLTSSSITGMGRVYAFGDELEVTPAIIEANRDRNGKSSLAWVEDGEDEWRRGDVIIARRGPWPAGTCKLESGSFSWTDAKAAAIKTALSVDDPLERQQRRRQVEEFYGPSKPTSKTHQVISAGTGPA